MLAALQRRRGLLVGLQLAFLAVLLGFLGWALRDTWADAWPRLRAADLVLLGVAVLLLSAYYLLFVLGWQWILRALGIHTTYSIALQAEMASMLAKYIPGGVWTPAARVVWLRKAGGVAQTSVVVASILLEAGLSAVAGVLVLVCALPFVDGWDAPLWPVVLFGIGIATLLHPRVFPVAARVVFRPFGGSEPPALPWPTMLGLLAFYSVSWVVGGVALMFLIRSVGGDVGLEMSAFSATVLNRLAITVVEAALLGAAVVAWRLRPSADRRAAAGQAQTG